MTSFYMCKDWHAYSYIIYIAGHSVPVHGYPTMPILVCSTFKDFPGRSKGFYLTHGLKIGCGKELCFVFFLIINGVHLSFHGNSKLLIFKTREIFSEAK